jgi:hypothetical protein
MNNSKNAASLPHVRDYKNECLFLMVRNFLRKIFLWATANSSPKGFSLVRGKSVPHHNPRSVS